MKKTYKTLSFLLCVVLLLLSCSTAAFADSTEAGDTVVLGDVNADGKVDTTDARAILRYAAGIERITDEVLLVCDMSGNGAITIEDAVLALKEASSIGGVVIPDKSGDNYLSDDPDNEFIKLIADTYDLDPKSLVAVYSVPDDGTNYVLRFDKTSYNEYEKSQDNLIYVYHIGLAPERKISYTNGRLYLLADHYNCEPAEGVMVFNIVKTTVMEQYPTYFILTEKE